MAALEDLADDIFNNEFSADLTVCTYESIYNWLKENLGLLNTLINTSFDGVDANLLNEEKAIYKELYLNNFYNKSARNALRGIMSTSAGDNILMVKDGDNQIQFVNKNEISKVFRGLAQDHKKNLDDLVAKYNIYGARPLQVGGYETIAPDITIVPAQQSITDVAQTIETLGLMPQILDGGVDN